MFSTKYQGIFNYPSLLFFYVLWEHVPACPFSFTIMKVDVHIRLVKSKAEAKFVGWIALVYDGSQWKVNL